MQTMPLFQSHTDDTSEAVIGESAVRTLRLWLRLLTDMAASTCNF